MQITVKYFAALAEHAGKSEEQIQGEALAIEPLYQELKQRYQFPLEFSEVRAAVNTRYVQPDTPLAEGDVVELHPRIQCTQSIPILRIGHT